MRYMVHRRFTADRVCYPGEIFDDAERVARPEVVARMVAAGHLEPLDDVAQPGASSVAVPPAPDATDSPDPNVTSDSGEPAGDVAPEDDVERDTESDVEPDDDDYPITATPASLLAELEFGAPGDEPDTPDVPPASPEPVTPARANRRRQPKGAPTPAATPEPVRADEAQPDEPDEPSAKDDE